MEIRAGTVKCILSVQPNILMVHKCFCEVIENIVELSDFSEGGIKSVEGRLFTLMIKAVELSEDSGMVVQVNTYNWSNELTFVLT